MREFQATAFKVILDVRMQSTAYERMPPFMLAKENTNMHPDAHGKWL